MSQRATVKDKRKGKGRSSSVGRAYTEIDKKIDKMFSSKYEVILKELTEEYEKFRAHCNMDVNEFFKMIDISVHEKMDERMRDIYGSEANMRPWGPEHFLEEIPDERQMMGRQVEIGEINRMGREIRVVSMPFNRNGVINIPNRGPSNIYTSNFNQIYEGQQNVIANFAGQRNGQPVNVANQPIFQLYSNVNPNIRNIQGSLSHSYSLSNSFVSQPNPNYSNINNFPRNLNGNLFRTEPYGVNNQQMPEQQNNNRRGEMHQNNFQSQLSPQPGNTYSQNGFNRNNNVYTHTFL